MTNIDNLSDTWRINKSAIKELEFLEALRSLRRLITYHTGDKLGNVRYMNQNLREPAYTSQDRDRLEKPDIYINPRTLKESNEYPVPGECFDVLCGIALHEVAHILTGSFEVSSNITYDTLKPVMILGEEICAETYWQALKARKQATYIAKARKHLDKGPVNCNTSNPLIDAILAAGNIVIRREPVTDISDKGREILLIILGGFKDLLTCSPHERCIVYKAVSDNIRQILDLEADKRRIADPRGKRLRAERTKEEFRRTERRKLEGEASDSMSNEWGEEQDENCTLSAEEEAELETLEREQASDVTQLVLSLVQSAFSPTELEEKGMQQERNELYLATHSIIVKTKEDAGGDYWEPDETLVRELQWLHTVKTTRESVIKREQEQGRLDKRRLYKAPIDGKVFRTEKKLITKQNIWLLMDSSGSMCGLSDALIFKSCAAVHKVIPKTRIYIYSDRGGDTYITRVDDRQGMKRTYPDGGTPSGDAIIYVTNLLQQEGGGIVIHFTDGEANAGMPVRDAYKVVERKIKKVGLITCAPRTDILSIKDTDCQRIQGVEVTNTGFPKLLRDAVAKMWNLM